MRILIVDDIPDDRLLVRREVDALFPDAEVIEPVDMAELDAALEAASPDLVVTDLDIAWTKGGAVLSAVKERYPRCPVVMFTGTGDEMIAVELMKAGLDDYVVKSPRQLLRLRASLKLAVEIARSRAALSDREAELEAMVAHRDTIVRELHHRVKNNLQTIISLLSYRGRQVDVITRAHFTDITGRLQALGAIQSRLYEVGTLDRADFCIALSDIAQTLAQVYDHAAVVSEFDGLLAMEIDRAMPLGLLCYEVILNAMKHAWPASSKGKLTIRVRARGTLPEIEIEDDGMGFETDAVVKGLGSRLLRSLAEEARVEVETVSTPGKGTLVLMRLA